MHAFLMMAPLPLQANFVKKLQNEKEGKAFVNVGFAHCKRLKWLDIDKSKGAPLVVRKVSVLSSICFLLLTFVFTIV